MAKYLAVVATTIYNEIEIEAGSKLEAFNKAMESEFNYNDGSIYETPYLETLEELDA